MAKFEIGDKVQMPDLPGVVVEVLGISECEDGPDCGMGGETFLFVDPETGAKDWEHSSEFERV